MNVFSSTRLLVAPKVSLPPRLKINKKLKMDGLKFLSKIPDNSIPASFFDPQDRGVYEQMKYGNEDTSRNHKRVEIPQMNDDLICEFISEISRVLMPSGHLFLWLDKFHLCTNFKEWFEGSILHTVDMITWNKKKIGLANKGRSPSTETRRKISLANKGKKIPRKVVLKIAFVALKKTG